ncbi:uncharacterized protein ACRADG_004968 [Cochliomyia hominivorax]
MGKPKVEIIIGLIIFIIFQVTLTHSVCLIQYPKNVEIAPVYKRIFGKYSIDIPFNSKGIELNEGEVVEGICRTNFSSIYSIQKNRDRYGYINDHHMTSSNETSIRLQCQNNEIYFKNSLLKEKTLQCKPLNWSIYDTNDMTSEWCEKNDNVKSFLFAVKTTQDHHILAGICYNLNDRSWQTVTYNVTSSGQEYNMEMKRDIKKTELKSQQELGDDLFNLKYEKIFDFTESELQQQLLNLTNINSWLNLANYELSSIVQGNSYKKYFNEYINILNTIWWRNLRLGNWKLFMDTLENYAHNNSFQLYSGTSGIVQVPTFKKDVYEILEIKNGYQNITVPAYIWTYLTSTDKQNQDLIIVGYNSPYAEFFPHNNIVFCPNICSEIPWLQEIHASFNFATAGIMFCCSPEYMKQTNYLFGFPMDILRSRLDTKESNLVTSTVSDDMILLNINDEETTTEIIETTTTTIYESDN